MKVRFDNGILNADDYGDIHIYESHYHGEVKLGSMDDDGNFEPSYWLEANDEFLGSLREALRRQYFGESKSYEEDKTQDSWDQRYLEFMKLDELPSIGNEWEALWQHELEPVEAHLRYRREDGSPLHGIFYNEELKKIQVIEKGQLLKAFQLIQSLSEEDRQNTPWVNLLCDSQLGWKDNEQPFSSHSEGTFHQCLNGKQNFGVIYCHNSAYMSELAEKAEKSDLKVLVYKHNNEEQHFRLVIFKENAFATLQKALPQPEGLSEDQSEKLKNLQAALNDEAFPSHLEQLAPFQNIEVPNSELEVYLKYSLLKLPQAISLSIALTTCFEDESHL